MSEQKNIVPLNVVRYVKDMTREERYEWNNYEVPSLERLETMIDVVRRGLQVDERDRPGVEKDLIALELVSDEAQGIINRSWIVAAAVGLLTPAVIGIATALNTSAATGIGVGIVCAIPSFIAGVPLSQTFSQDFIFTPLANKFVDKRVKF